ncbi:MAG: hypothetical protein GXP45_03885 [bacterium]|nr:hypothetical protein [bacterium]
MSFGNTFLRIMACQEYRNAGFIKPVAVFGVIGVRDFFEYLFSLLYSSL